jgi:hypothetical protein
MKTSYFMIGGLLLVCALLACATADSELLARDYTQLSDEDLLRYYYDLDEEIARCERQADRASVGVGTGVFGRGVGFGVGYRQGVATCDSQALRQRRIDVRMALKRRGLNP